MEIFVIRALCSLGVLLLDGLAGRCDAALMERRARAERLKPAAAAVVSSVRLCSMNA
jgi:hypothetical protein